MKIALFLIPFILAAVPSFAAGDAKDSCFQLLENRCQKCHYLPRVCRGVDNKSKGKWNSTLKRMVNKRGVELAEGEQEFLLECLATPAADVREGCKALNN